MNIIRTLNISTKLDDREEIDSFDEFVHLMASLVDYTTYDVQAMSEPLDIPSVCHYTSPKQLEYIAMVLETRLNDLSDDPHPDAGDDPEIAALFNFLCDLKTEGYKHP